jgi:hypothetical protein
MGCVRSKGKAVTATKHNFDRPLADDVGNINAVTCSRCGKTTELDRGDIPEVIKHEECEAVVATLDTLSEMALVHECT